MKTIIGAALTMVVGALAYHQPAEAATFKVMNHGKSIVMTGEIVEGDAARLQGALDNAPIVRRIFLNSRGGLALEGQKIGAVVIGRDLDTVVGATDMCASACFTVFAASLRKHVFPTSCIGVHNVSTTGSKGQSVVSSDGTLYWIAFYKKVGVPPSVLGKIAMTPPKEMTYLDLDDYVAFNVTVLKPVGNTVVDNRPCEDR